MSAALRALCMLTTILPLLAGCADAAPPCPFTGQPNTAPSAGCFAIAGEKLLLVQGFNGKISVPGGSSKPDEIAQCAAFRETWEETGLSLEPKELAQVFSTGFHLYHCGHNARSGEVNPPLRFEIRDAFYLSVDQFDDYDWRFASQKEQLKKLVLMKTNTLSVSD